MLLKFLGAALPRGSALAIAALLYATVAAAQRAAAVSPAQGPDLTAMDLEQLMKLEVVVAGSKRSQQTRDVPSFVSVVTAAQIKEHGYRTLADVLQTLPSFYVSNDRNYSYAGVRGFDRPGDYNTRILLLLNGLRTNDNVAAHAHFGEDFVVDVDLIERIEVIRGPSAAIYGSNAFFAVINVVTKQGRELHGAEVAATAASFGTYAGRASYGKTFDNDLDVVVSASVSDSKGQRLYFRDFNTPATNNGIVDGADYENFYKLLATATKGNFSFQASDVSREKGVPTGSFGTYFGDTRTNTVDKLSLASLSYSRSLSESTSFSARVHTGYSANTGMHVFNPMQAPNENEAVGEWWGADMDARRKISRHLLTVGAEYQDDIRQDNKDFDPSPAVTYFDQRNRSERWGAFAQDEVTVFAPLVFYAGIRYDWYETFGAATNPRVGLIYTPSSETTVKLLAGRAFRAPDVYELYADNSLFEPNLSLQPERIETLELVAQHFFGEGVQLSGSAFRNRLTSLINQVVDTSDQNRLEFVNAGEIDSKGLELGVGLNHGHGLSGEVNYTLQRTEDRATHTELTDSPRQMTKVTLRAPLGAGDATVGLDAQYVADRKTLAGSTAPSYVVTNLSLLAPRTFGRFDVSATIYNLFNAAYSVPGSVEHVQDVIPQDGRSFRVKTTLHF